MVPESACSVRRLCFAVQKTTQGRSRRVQKPKCEREDDTEAVTFASTFTVWTETDDCSAEKNVKPKQLSPSSSQPAEKVPAAFGDIYDNEKAGSTGGELVEVSAVESVSLGGFFGTVWDFSLALGAFLAALGPEAIRKKKVVELGAGCGVVAAVCAALGASEVVATDVRDLFPLLTLNLERNCKDSQCVKV